MLEQCMKNRRFLRPLVKVFVAALVAIGPSLAQAEVAPLSVQGNQVTIGGQPGSLAGNSLFWSNNGWGGEKYYNADVVQWLKQDWKSPLVRAAMGVEDPGGYLEDRASNRAKVERVVDAAIANDMYVIIDWHSHHAENHTAAAVEFFEAMAWQYGHYNNVIYEIYNEPLGVSWSNTIKPYAETVISAIRAIDPDNLIIVGTPYWSQNVDEASWDPITNYSNIAYTLHFYAGTHMEGLRTKAQQALDNGIALFVTEWGTVNANGDGAVNHASTDAWMDFLRANNISHANWSINDKNEGASALLPGASATGGWTSLTASGEKVRDIVRNWAGTTPGGDVTEGPCVMTAVPGTVEAEHFCHASGVTLEPASSGGQNVGYIDAGDWMTYAVDLPSAGSVDVTYRVASAVGGGQIQLEAAGGTGVYGVIDVPNTGGWQNWQTVTHRVTLPAGVQRLGLTAITGGWNLDAVTFSPACTHNCSSDPLVVQAEGYDYMSGVQTESTTDTGGGLNVGWIDAGDWMSYPAVTIPEDGAYIIEYRVASNGSGGTLQFEAAGGSPVYGTLDIPHTGGWQSWTTVQHTVNLSAGEQRFGLYAVSGGWNLNWFSIRPAQ